MGSACRMIDDRTPPRRPCPLLPVPCSGLLLPLLLLLLQREERPGQHRDCAAAATMLAPQANNNRFGSKEKKLKATLKFSAAFKTKVSCTGASGAGLSCRWLTAPARRWT